MGASTLGGLIGGEIRYANALLLVLNQRSKIIFMRRHPVMTWRKAQANFASLKCNFLQVV